MKKKINQLKLVGNCATCGNPIYGNLDLEENKDPVVKRTCFCSHPPYTPIPFTPIPTYPWYQEPYKITYTGKTENNMPYVYCSN